MTPFPTFVVVASSLVALVQLLHVVSGREVFAIGIPVPL